MAKHKRKYPHRPKIRRVEYEPTPSLTSGTKRGIFIVLILVIAFLSLLSFFNLAGSFGIYLRQFLGLILGWGLYLLPLILTALAFVLLNPERFEVKPSNYFGLCLLILSLVGLFQLMKGDPAIFITDSGGGYLGYALTFPIQKIVGSWATLVIIIALLIISLLITFNTSLNNLIQNLNIVSLVKRKLTKTEANLETKGEWEEEDLSAEASSESREVEEERESEEIIKEEDELAKIPTLFTTKKIPQTTRKVRLIPEGLNVTYASGKPLKVDVPINLLDNKTSKPTSGDIKANMEKIQKTLKNFGLEVEMGEVNVGPTVTQFTLKPAHGIRLSQIVALQNDLALALAAHPIRIEAPIPGKALVGIEVPNQSIALVRLKEILISECLKKKRGNLNFSLGKNVAGQAWVADLSTMPHLLIAGATGSGKSVCINNIIISLLYQHSPDSLRLILVDPKRVEFTTYNGLPHLLTPVITEVDKTINALRWVINEMDDRYRLFSAVGRRNIEVYNASVITNRLPYIIVIIDELAALMSASPRDVEAAIVRLAQMARATGIHLVVATQRPSVDVITGLIKANITSRIAFAVASQVDSRTIIDTAGADKLLGKGDMLFVSAEISKPRRFQCPFVSDEEIERVVDFWKQQIEPEYHEEVIVKQANVNLPGLSGLTEGGDELLDEAKEVILNAGKASASLLQRRLRVGYARAARLLDLLEEQGIIGPADGAKPREILVSEKDFAISSETTERYQEEIEEYSEEEDETQNIENDREENKRFI